MPFPPAGMEATQPDGFPPLPEIILYTSGSVRTQ